MADSATDERAMEETASETPRRVRGEEFLEAVKAHHRANRTIRASERRESDNPPPADMISEMRDERDEQILSAALGVYD